MATLIYYPMSISGTATTHKTVPRPVLSGIQSTKVFKELSTDNNERLNSDANKMNLNRDTTEVCRGGAGRVPWALTSVDVCPIYPNCTHGSGY